MKALSMSLNGRVRNARFVVFLVSYKIGVPKLPYALFAQRAVTRFLW